MAHVSLPSSEEAEACNWMPQIERTVLGSGVQGRRYFLAAACFCFPRIQTWTVIG